MQLCIALNHWRANASTTEHTFHHARSADRSPTVQHCIVNISSGVSQVSHLVRQRVVHLKRVHATNTSI
jgi:hypothetical protein